MDRDALVRAVRRRQLTEALGAERGRAEALGDRLEELVTELDGPAFDEQILSSLRPEEAAFVRAVLAGDDESLYPDEPDTAEAAAELTAYRESEVARLVQELDMSRIRQRALEHYLELLG